MFFDIINNMKKFGKVKFIILLIIIVIEFVFINDLSYQLDIAKSSLNKLRQSEENKEYLNNLKCDNCEVETQIYSDYIVRQGDTLESIAQKYDISIDCIKRANSFDQEVFKNQKLHIPFIDDDVKIFDNGKLIFDNCKLFIENNFIDINKINPIQIEPFLILPFSSTSFKVQRCYSSFHKGIDFIVEENKEVVAPASGQVVYVGYDPISFTHTNQSTSSGLSIIIIHSNLLFAFRRSLRNRVTIN